MSIAKVGKSFVACLLAGIWHWGSAQPINSSQSQDLERQSLKAAASMLRNDFFRPLDQTVFDALSIDEMIERAEPDHGSYLTMDEYGLFVRGLASNAGRFGIRLQRKDGAIIVSPITPSPASWAGLTHGDKLVSVRGEEIRDLGLTAVHRLFAASGRERVTLTVRRSGMLMTFLVDRADVGALNASPHVEWATPEVLVLRVPELPPAALRASAQILASEFRRSLPRGVILDLRGNPGGTVQCAIGHAAIFLRSSLPVAHMRGRSPDRDTKLLARPDDYATGDGPDHLLGLPAELKWVSLAVLINESTDAGAEMIAAALQYHKRALIVGRASSGNARIQVLQRLPNGGALRYTTAHWTSPSGAQIEGIGVVPDVVVNAVDPEDDVSVALKVLNTGKVR